MGIDGADIKIRQGQKEEEDQKSFEEEGGGGVAIRPAESRSKNPNEKFCTECGLRINAKAEICPKCGVRQAPPPSAFGNTAPNGKSKIAAALFAFFLGGFGAHKFYLGQIGLGIVYLIFCWTFIPSIIAFVEFILLLVMSDEEFTRKYGYS